MSRSARVGLAAVTTAALALGAAACGEQRGTGFICSCAYLTDFDDASRQAVSICAPSADRAPVIAQGCAQTGAPAPVQGCTCEPRGGASCALGECALTTR